VSRHATQLPPASTSNGTITDAAIMPRKAQGTLFLPLASLIPVVIPPTRRRSLCRED
jgi:hypothetical protein